MTKKIIIWQKIYFFILNLLVVTFAREIIYSVTRLGIFFDLVATNFLSKVAKEIGYFGGYLEKIAF